jgi:hypothetical protein
MRTRLNHGKLIPPASIRQARERSNALAHEISLIDKRLMNTERRANFDTEQLFLAWVTRTKSARVLLKAELSQLRAWLMAAEHPLFKDAYKLLKTLESEDCDFDPPELELISRLDRYFE